MLQRRYCHSIVNKDLTFKAKVKVNDLPYKTKVRDFYFVLEDTSRPSPRPRTNISGYIRLLACNSTLWYLNIQQLQ